MTHLLKPNNDFCASNTTCGKHWQIRIELPALQLAFSRYSQPRVVQKAVGLFSPPTSTQVNSSVRAALDTHNLWASCFFFEFMSCRKIGIKPNNISESFPNHPIIGKLVGAPWDGTLNSQLHIHLWSKTSWGCFRMFSLTQPYERWHSETDPTTWRQLKSTRRCHPCYWPLSISLWIIKVNRVSHRILSVNGWFVVCAGGLIFLIFFYLWGMFFQK